MKILFLTSRLPYPPDRGDRLRVYNFARQLAKHHHLTLISFVSAREQAVQLEQLKEIFHEVHCVYLPAAKSILSALIGLFRADAFQVLYYRSQVMSRVIKQVTSSGRFDLVYTHLVRMAPYGLRIKNVVRILDMTDVISTEIRLSLRHRAWISRWIYEIELEKLMASEKKFSGLFDETWVISPSEYTSLRNINPSATIRVVTNGVDYSRFIPKKTQPEAHSLVFVGHMGVYHNIHAATHLAQDIFPLIQARLPSASLEIVGAEPVKQVLQLARIPGVSVRGYIADLPAVLHQAAVFVAPLQFAAGTQNKVLEAMATATPVITTPLVNQGIGAVSGEEIILAEDRQSFIQAALHLLTDPGEAWRIALNGRQFVQERFSWQNVNQAVNELSIR